MKQRKLRAEVPPWTLGEAVFEVRSLLHSVPDAAPLVAEIERELRALDPSWAAIVSAIRAHARAYPWRLKICFERLESALAPFFSHRRREWARPEHAVALARGLSDALGDASKTKGKTADGNH